MMCISDSQNYDSVFYNFIKTGFCQKSLDKPLNITKIQYQIWAAPDAGEAIFMNFLIKTCRKC